MLRISAYTALATALLTASLTSLASASTLAGDSIQSFFTATGVGTYAGPVTTVAPGTISPYPGIFSSGTFSVIYTDTTITLLSAGGVTGFGSPYTFNGIVFNLLGGPMFTADSIDPSTTLSGFTSADLGLLGNSLSVDLKGLTFSRDQRLVLNVSTSTAQTPEPSTLSLIGTGVLGLAGLARRRLFA